MIQQAQIPQYNAQAHAMMGQVAQGLGGLGEAYQDRKFRKDFGGVSDTKSLLELYTMHPDKYDPNRVKQMQLQEAAIADQNFFDRLEGAQTQEDALKVIKSDPKRYTSKIQEFMDNLPSPKKEALRKDLLEEGAYVNTGKFDQLPALFDAREKMVMDSNLHEEEKAERLDDIAEDRKFLAAGPEIFAERHRLSEEGVLGAEAYEKLMKGRKERNLGYEVASDAVSRRASEAATTAKSLAEADDIPLAREQEWQKMDMQEQANITERIKANTGVENAKLQREIFENEKLVAEGKIPESVQKQLTESIKTQEVGLKNLRQTEEIISGFEGISAEEFGGGLTTELTAKLQRAMTGAEWAEGEDGKDAGAKLTVLRTQLAGLTLSEAFAQKAAGSLTEGEMKELQKAVISPTSNKAAIARFLYLRHKAARGIMGQENVRKKFLRKYKGGVVPKGGDILEVNGIKIPLKAEMDAQDALNMIGMKAPKYAEEFGKENKTLTPTRITIRPKR